jgi:hypothetical protein
MTQRQRTIGHSDAATVVAASARPAALQEINIYDPTTLLYWWPAWCFGFGIVLLNAGQEKFLPTAFTKFPGSSAGESRMEVAPDRPGRTSIAKQPKQSQP